MVQTDIIKPPQEGKHKNPATVPFPAEWKGEVLLYSPDLNVTDSPEYQNNEMAP